MDRRIFDQKLSVEGTSLYLLMTALSDQGATLRRETMLPMWNASPEKLDGALKELAGRGIAGQDAGGAWFLNPATHWRPA
ncbi:MAG: hypothetical protein C4525_12215 [Desulfarculus sp.]|jgi:hypothetical protein|nr:MAG: hypothetical protein C4525_12215 [Desulfarculus sp.]